MFQGEGRYYNPYKYDSNLISFGYNLLLLYTLIHTDSILTSRRNERQNLQKYNFLLSFPKAMLIMAIIYLLIKISLWNDFLCVCLCEHCFVLWNVEWFLLNIFAECEFTEIKKIVFLLFLLCLVVQKERSLFWHCFGTLLFV